MKTKEEISNILILACKAGHLAKAKSLISAGVDVNLEVLQGDSLLHLAAAYGDEKIAELLIQSGAQVNKLNRNGSTPLHWASRPLELSSVSMAGGRANVFRLLLAAGADATIKNQDGETALDLNPEVATIYQEHLAKIRTSDIAQKMESVIDGAISGEVVASSLGARRNRAL